VIAEDEESSRFLYFEEFSEEGYNVLTAENGLQVLGYLEDKKVDLLVTDVKMPDMHAMEMIPRIRGEFKSLPIIVVSAFKGMEEDFNLRGFGVARFFAKPVDMKALLKSVEEILAEAHPPKA
jgi:DNA-binding response OmpR family regulator